MKTIILAFAIWMALAGVVSIEPADAGWAGYEAANSGTGPGGNLQDLSSVDLTDCCNNVLSAR